MKRIDYSKPLMAMEKFVPQEFISLCFYADVSLWKETNGVPGLQELNTLVAPNSQSHPHEAFEPYIDSAREHNHLEGPDGYGQYIILPDEQTGWQRIRTDQMPVRFVDCDFYPALINTTSVTREYVMLVSDGQIYYCNNVQLHRDYANRS